MCTARLDSRDRFPDGMEDYLSQNGWHFNKKMCEYAVKRMKRKGKTGEQMPLEPYDYARCEAILKQYGVDTSDFIGYDFVYVLNMCRSDYYGSSIVDEPHLALFVKDYLGDPDGYEGMAFTRFYADCIGKGALIPWDDML